MAEGVLNLNERAMRVADELADRAGELGCAVQNIGGARIIDAGVKQRGSINAGLLVARICLADLGSATVTPGRVADTPCPVVSVSVSHPVAACMASQYAGWQVSVGKYFAMGSGPMRAAWGKEKLYDDIGFREKPGCAVGVLEGKLPDEPTIAHIAQQCGVAAERLTLVAARTASLVGGAQVVARSVETALHKLHELKFDLTRIIAGFGEAPLPPVAKDDLAAIGRTNDAVLYGGACTLYVTGDDESLADAGAKLPSSVSKDYGEPFAAIFQRYNHDFYKIDPMLFSPALVNLQNVQTGRSHVVGRLNLEVLAVSFGWRQ